MTCPGLTGTGCNAANGEVCNTFTGVCMGGGVPQCDNCSGGTCIPPAFPGSQSAPTCLQNSGSACPATPCVGDSRCYLGQSCGTRIAVERP